MYTEEREECKMTTKQEERMHRCSSHVRVCVEERERMLYTFLVTMDKVEIRREAECETCLRSVHRCILRAHGWRAIYFRE